jgi:co-chaperonin GroES (HSP10)
MMMQTEITPLEAQRKKRIAEDEHTLMVAEAQLEKMLPIPVGYHLMVVMPEVKDTFNGTNIAKAETTLRHDAILSMVGLVVDMGTQAYTDPSRFPNGPWCKVGDYVMFRANSGTRFKVQGKEYRLINDDTIEAVVADPNGIQRA